MRRYKAFPDGYLEREAAKTAEFLEKVLWSAMRGYIVWENGKAKIVRPEAKQ